MSLLKLSKNRLLPTFEEPQQEVSLSDWRANPQGHMEATALVISNSTSLADMVDDLSGFSVIVLDFPTFKDGRAYTQARLLRERLGYHGEIRARGDVLRDQILFMVRCGINAFEVSGDISTDLQTALNEFSFSYQAAADGIQPVWRKRVNRARAA